MLGLPSTGVLRFCIIKRHIGHKNTSICIVREGIFEGYKFSWFSWLKSNPQNINCQYAGIYLVYVWYNPQKFYFAEITNLSQFQRSTNFYSLKYSLPYDIEMYEVACSSCTIDCQITRLEYLRITGSNAHI